MNTHTHTNSMKSSNLSELRELRAAEIESYMFPLSRYARAIDSPQTRARADHLSTRAPAVKPPWQRAPASQPTIYVAPARTLPPPPQRRARRSPSRARAPSFDSTHHAALHERIRVSSSRLRLFIILCSFCTPSGIAFDFRAHRAVHHISHKSHQQQREPKKYPPPTNRIIYIFVQQNPVSVCGECVYIVAVSARAYTNHFRDFGHTLYTYCT